MCLFNRIITRACYALLLTVLLNAGQVGLAQTIKKCQDADGKWHYGDFTAEGCAQSKITEINTQGIKIKESQAPASAEQLEVERATKARQAEQQADEEEQRRKDANLLVTFESEQSVIQARDDRYLALARELVALERLQTRLKSQRDLLEQDRQASTGREQARLEGELVTLDDQLIQYQASLADKQAQRRQVGEKYDKFLADYRAIINRSPAETLPATSLPGDVTEQ